jgi:hypothetical protein
MKANKWAQYRRNWAAAARTLRQADCDTTPAEQEDSTELVELSFNSSPPTSDTGSEPEVLEPVPKHGRTCSVQNCSSTHNSIDLDEIRPDPYSSSSSDSEDDDVLAKGLGNWANKFLIKHNALDGLYLFFSRRMVIQICPLLHVPCCKQKGILPFRKNLEWSMFIFH